MRGKIGHSSPVFRDAKVFQGQACPSRGLFDPDFYLRENPEVGKFGLDPWIHYLERGGFEGRNPNPLFDSGWYRSTYLQGYVAQNPLMHYLEEGASMGLDPHPLFDSRCYGLGLGENDPDLTLLEHFLSSGEEAVAGAYRSLEALGTVQRRFYEVSGIDILEDHRKTPKRWAVFLQAGHGSLDPEWLTEGEKPWDLLVNFYDGSFDRSMPLDVRIHQGLGTKFSGIHRLLECQSHLLSPYDYVFLLDDDIRVSEDGITQAFRAVESLGLDLAQPSLRPGSHGTWELLFQKPGSIGRFLSAVEIMMPILSRRALSLGRYLFGRTVSGWGLDFALGQEVRRCYGETSVGVIDAIAFAHERPIDPEGGAYYRMLRDHGLSPLVEERAIELLYGARGPIRDCNLTEPSGDADSLAADPELQGKIPSVPSETESDRTPEGVEASMIEGTAF